MTDIERDPAAFVRSFVGRGQAAQAAVDAISQPSLLEPTATRPPAKRRVEFHCVGVPQTQGSKTAVIPHGWVRPIVIDKNSRSLRGWRDTVGSAAQSRLDDGGLLEGPVVLTVVFHLPRAKSTPKKAAAHTKAPDVDKLTRAVMDALTKIIWRDDSQVVELVARKQYGEPPGVHVVVEEL